MCIHICGCTDLEQHTEPWLLQRHQSCWPWPLTPPPLPTPSPSQTHTHTQTQMHPTPKLVYTQRICNCTVCLKCPKFLCKMEHLNRHHASAPATNCSAHQPQTEFLKFISVRRVVYVLSIYSSLGGSQCWPFEYLCGATKSTFQLRVCSEPLRKNTLVSNHFPLQPLHFNCIHRK